MIYSKENIVPAVLTKKNFDLPGALPRALYFSDSVQSRDAYGDTSFTTEVINPALPHQANVISSKIAGTDLHAPVLDIDVPHTLLPSSTPGHSHLYLDVQISWRTYKKLLRALVKAGIIEDGYYKASKRRGFTAVRLPWIKKPR